MSFTCFHQRFIYSCIMTRLSLILTVSLALTACNSVDNKTDTIDDYMTIKKICDSALTLTNKYFKNDTDAMGKIDFDASLPSTRPKTDYDYLVAGRELINTTLVKVKNDSLRLLLLSTKMKSCLMQLIPDPEYNEESLANTMQEYFKLSKTISNDKYNVLKKSERTRLDYEYEENYKAHFNIQRLRREGKGDSIDKAWQEEINRVKADTVLPKIIQHMIDSIKKSKTK